MNGSLPCCDPLRFRTRRFDHRIVCQHQIEIEVWPASAEVYFQDGRFIEPVNTQVRFDAAVFNTPNAQVRWEVLGLDGGPGQGSIDATGLYLAPARGGLASGLTEVVAATAVADPLRRAFAYVTLVDRSPEPPLHPTLVILPQRVNLYYQADIAGAKNEWVDNSNKRQVFRAIVQDSDPVLRWYVGNSLQAEQSPLFYYDPGTNSGGDTCIKVRAELVSHPAVSAEARIVLVNYGWPAIVLP